MAALITVGAAILAVALSPPVDRLAEQFLTAHMVQHMMIATLAPLLLVAGVGADKRRATFAGRKVTASVAWLAGIGVTAVWHVPLFFTVALENPAVHVIEHASLLFAGLLFWWPVFGPQSGRLEPIAAGPYLITACVACTVIGVIIAFGPPGLYPAYRAPRDQQLAGVMMWVPGCIVYLTSVMCVLARYYSHG